DFDRWAAAQKGNAIFPVAAPAAPAPTPPAAQAGTVRPVSNSAAVQAPATPPQTATPPAAPAAAEPWRFPAEKIPAYTIPRTPIPPTLRIADDVIAAGNAQRGYETYSKSACIGCHKIRGNPMSMGVIGPDLTHV